MKFLVIIIFILIFITPSIHAQQISIEEFDKVKQPFFKKSEEKNDKQNAILKLITNEGEFKFSINGVPVKAESGEGVIVVSMPHKSNFMTVAHPAYGQISWKAPIKELKRKKRYQANLITNSPDKEYKVNKQWCVFYINPNNAIIYMDSVINHVNSGIAQYYLPLGKHSYKIVSPFYEEFTGVIDVSDSLRVENRVNLVPLYSYLTINTNVSGAEIRLDGKLIGSTVAHTGKIMQGEYLLTVTKPLYAPYSSKVLVGAAERRVVDVTLNSAQLFGAKSSAVDSVQISGDVVMGANPVKNTKNTKNSQNSKNSQNTQNKQVVTTQQAIKTIKAPVTIKAFDPETQILINRESVGTGEWSGVLDAGFYSISTIRDAFQSKSYYLWVENDKPIIVDMATPKDNYGTMNISCNVVDAKITLNGLVVGQTPCVLQNLAKDRSYTVRVEKRGYNRVEKVVYLRENDIIDVDIKLVAR